MEFSVMTYRKYVGADGSNDSPADVETFSFAQTLMMLDIAALQYMYGANFNTNPGSTVYTWSPTTGQMFIDGVAQAAPGGNRIFLTVWDGNGVDTYDLSNYSTNLNIDLAPGGWSVFDSAQLAQLSVANSIFARGNVFNALQFNNDARSLIENAIGGSGNDTITGNAANNALTGGLGNDTINGGAGADQLRGGTGDDTLTIDSSDTVVDGGDGNDTVNLTGNGMTFNLAFSNIENANGTAGNDQIDGSHSSIAAALTLNGLAGSDTLSGGGLGDTINGGDGDTACSAIPGSTSSTAASGSTSSTAAPTATPSAATATTTPSLPRPATTPSSAMPATNTPSAAPATTTSPAAPAPTTWSATTTSSPTPVSPARTR
jgi:serralysin